jgi:xyloglucan-specific endo-beta-1,4-glucanase
MTSLTKIATGILAVAALSQAAPALSQSCTAQFCTFDFGSYFVQNNEWGSASDPNGGQSVTVDSSGWHAGMLWHYTNGAIKSYPSIVAGWQWGHWSPSRQGFPVLVSANAPLRTTASWYNLGTFQNWDVAYDLFFSPSANPATPSAELMVWLAYGGQKPAGTKVASGVKLGGVSGTWDVWQGTVDWPVWSFVRTAPASSFSGDLQPFIYYVAFVKNWLNRSWYSLGMEFGIEPIAASGEFHCTSFSASAY